MDCDSAAINESVQQSVSNSHENAAYLGQDRHLQGVHKFNFAHDSVAASILSLPTGAVAQTETVEEHWIASLENFDVADTGVCDMGVYARCSVPAWSRSGAAGNCLIIA